MTEDFPAQANCSSSTRKEQAWRGFASDALALNRHRARSTTVSSTRFLPELARPDKKIDPLESITHLSTTFLTDKVNPRATRRVEFFALPSTFLSVMSATQSRRQQLTKSLASRW
jgi:hypothetical protein